MAASVTHIVVGEKILKQTYPGASVEVQGAFLAGCILVDGHVFNPLDRRDIIIK